VRYHAGITTKTQLSTTAATFMVRGVQDVELRNQFLMLACEQLP
jgi:head-tail adaptor